MLNILSVPNKVKCCAAYEFVLHFSFILIYLFFMDSVGRENRNGMETRRA